MVAHKKIAVKRSFPDNDSSMADAFLERVGPEIGYVTELRRWRVWNGKHWEDDPNGARVRHGIERFVRSLQATEEHERKLRRSYLGAVKLGHIEQRCRDKQMVSVREFDTKANAYLVNMANGVLDCDSGDLYEHDPEFFLTNLIDVDYNPSVKPGEWNRWLRMTIPNGDIREALQTIMGYSIFVDGNPERLLVLLKGPTSTGKSTFLETIDNVLGAWAKTFNLTIFRAKQGESARPDIVAVLDARVIHTSEASDEWQLHADHIKRFVGGDTLTTRKLYGEMFEQMPSCVPIVATNEIPQIKGADEALFRRFVAVPFKRKISHRRVKTNLAHKLATKCGSEIFQWLLEGYWNYKEIGLASARKTLSVQTRQAFNETNVYSQFMAECTIRDDDHVLSNDEIKSRFTEWVMRTGIDYNTGSGVELGRRLTGLGWKPYRTGAQRGRIGRRFK